MGGACPGVSGSPVAGLMASLGASNNGMFAGSGKMSRCKALESLWNQATIQARRIGGDEPDPADVLF